MYGTKRKEEEKCSRGWCYPPNCMPDSDCIFYSLSSLFCSLFFILFLFSRSSILLHLWQQYLRATHPRDHGTPVRKCGIRNIIAPLRRVSLVYTRLSSSFSSPPPVFISAASRPTTCIRKRHRTECITRQVCKVSCLKCCRRSILLNHEYTVFADHVITATNR